MTFLEAAIEVLRHESGPLHYGEIARQAVARKLLSHVGRDPEAAMKSCLMSAVRGGAEAPVQRAKPGHYEIRPGATLPDVDLPEGALAPGESAPPEKAKKTTKKASKKAAKKTAKKAAKKTPKKASKKSAAAKDRAAESDAAENGSAEADAENGVASAEASSAEGVDAEPSAEGSEASEGDGDRPKVQFEAPAGSGLEGVTDVALVMANAMSRLADERPELRQELEAMQQGEAQVPEIKHKPTPNR